MNKKGLKFKFILIYFMIFVALFLCEKADHKIPEQVFNLYEEGDSYATRTTQQGFDLKSSIIISLGVGVCGSIIRADNKKYKKTIDNHSIIVYNNTKST